MYGHHLGGATYRHGSIRFGCPSCKFQYSIPYVSARGRLCVTCRTTQKNFVCIDCGQDKVVMATRKPSRCEPCRKQYLLWMNTGRGSSEAHGIVGRAVAAGDLPAARGQQCADCGDVAVEYDHRDYNKPLDVAAVCRRCNLMRGKAKPTNTFNEWLASRHQAA